MPHHCHAIGCDIAVAPKLLMCRKHWYMVPLELRNEVWRCYRPGQERTKNPSSEYLVIARQAIYAVAIKEGRMSQIEADEALAALNEFLK